MLDPKLVYVSLLFYRPLLYYLREKANTEDYAMINKAHFGKRIASLRKGMNLTQADLAEKLGVTSQSASK